jgi:hypothetical protein
MTQEQAVLAISNMMLALQNMRRNADDADRVTRSMLMPWVFDDQKCPLNILSRLLDADKAGHAITPMVLYNMMIIANILQPEIALFVALANAESGYELPTPSNIMPDVARGGWNGQAQREKERSNAEA